MRPGALPVEQQILVDLIAPPIGALLWRVIAGGWPGARIGDASEETRRRRASEFWVILILGYLLMFGISFYTWFA
jgi:hypothetical protein